MPDQFKVGVVQQMDNILFLPGEEIVETVHFIPFIQ